MPTKILIGESELNDTESIVNAFNDFLQILVRTWCQL